MESQISFFKDSRSVAFGRFCTKIHELAGANCDVAKIKVILGINFWQLLVEDTFFGSQ
jgi:hypothetical protein